MSIRMTALNALRCASLLLASTFVCVTNGFAQSVEVPTSEFGNRKCPGILPVPGIEGNFPLPDMSGECVGGGTIPPPNVIQLEPFIDVAQAGKKCPAPTPILECVPSGPIPVPDGGPDSPPPPPGTPPTPILIPGKQVIKGDLEMRGVYGVVENNKLRFLPDTGAKRQKLGLDAYSDEDRIKAGEIYLVFPTDDAGAALQNSPTYIFDGGAIKK